MNFYNNLIKYKVFIDESGKKEFIDPYNKKNITRPPSDNNKEFWRKNYFVIVGLIISTKTIPKINKEIMELKINTFGTPYVEVKSDWLRNPYQRKKQYLDKFGIDNKRLNQFGTSISNLIPLHKNDIKIISVIFDKRYYKDRINNDPLLNSGQVLFERIQFSMNKYRSYCILVSDQMDDSISAKRGKNKELKDVLLNKRMMKRTFVEKYTRIKDINFIKSKNENLIQIADLVAYNIYRQFVDYGRVWDNETIKKFGGYKYFCKIVRNFLDKDGLISGISICKLPSPKKIRWKLPKK